MSLVMLIVLLIVVGAAIALIPMDPRIKTAAVVVVLLFVVVWILSAFGLIHGGPFGSVRMT